MDLYGEWLWWVKEDFGIGSEAGGRKGWKLILMVVVGLEEVDWFGFIFDFLCGYGCLSYVLIFSWDIELFLNILTLFKLKKS